MPITRRVLWRGGSGRVAKQPYRGKRGPQTSSKCSLLMTCKRLKQFMRFSALLTARAEPAKRGFRCRLAVGYGMLAMGCCFTACVVGHAKLQLHFTGKHFLLPLFQHSPTPSTQSANRSNQFVAVRIRFYFIAIRFTWPLLWVQISFQHDASFKPN